MVWSQYVYEATIGFETSHASDDEDLTDDTPLNVEDWEVQYSDELWYMWGMMNTLLEHEYVVWEYQEERLSHIWKHLRRVVNQNGHHKEMMRGATFYHFVDYAKNYMCIY
jgi:hypothetical protein